jgi:hypothetical protein
LNLEIVVLLDEADLIGLHVLLVDDDFDFRESLTILLELVREQGQELVLGPVRGLRLPTRVLLADECGPRDVFDAVLHFRVFQLHTGVFVSSPLPEVGQSVRIASFRRQREAPFLRGPECEVLDRAGVGVANAPTATQAIDILASFRELGDP